MDNLTPSPSSNSNGVMSAIRVLVVLCALSAILWIVTIVKAYLTSLSPGSLGVLNIDIFSLIQLGNSLVSFLLGIIAIILGISAGKQDNIRNNLWVRWVLILGVFELIMPIASPFVAIIFLGPR